MLLSFEFRPCVQPSKMKDEIVTIVINRTLTAILIAAGKDIGGMCEDSRKWEH